MRRTYAAKHYLINKTATGEIWILSSVTDIRYISVAVCFVAFLFNDVYGFYNWQRIEKRQKNAASI